MPGLSGGSEPRKAPDFSGDFHGAKLALIAGSQVLTCQRDDFPWLIWPGCHDLPGGGREGNENPEACVLRELHEEFGLVLPPSRLEHRLHCAPEGEDPRPSWFFAGRITPEEIASVRFGSEGQGWQMMEISLFLSRKDAVPVLQRRLQQFLALHEASGRGL